MNIKKSHLTMAFVCLLISCVTLAATEQERQLEIKQRTEAAINQSDEGLVSVTHADGTVSLDLQGRFQNFSKVVVDENGKKHFICNMHPNIEHMSHNSDGSPIEIVSEAVPR